MTVSFREWSVRAEPPRLFFQRMQPIKKLVVTQLQPPPPGPYSRVSPNAARGDPLEKIRCSESRQIQFSLRQKVSGSPEVSRRVVKVPGSKSPGPVSILGGGAVSYGRGAPVLARPRRSCRRIIPQVGSCVVPYRGASLIRNNPPVGPHSSNMSS